QSPSASRMRNARRIADPGGIAVVSSFFSISCAPPRAIAAIMSENRHTMDGGGAGLKSLVSRRNRHGRTLQPRENREGGPVALGSHGRLPRRRERSPLSPRQVLRVLHAALPLRHPA